MSVPFGPWWPFAGPEQLPLWNEPEDRPKTDERCPKCGSDRIRTMQLVVSFHLQCEACLWYGADQQLVDAAGKRIREHTVNWFGPPESVEEGEDRRFLDEIDKTVRAGRPTAEQWAPKKEP